MWLVFCANNSVAEIKKRLAPLVAKANVQVRYIEAVKTVPLESNLVKLTAIINDYDYVICVSPSCIEIAKTQIALAHAAKFLVMGKQSQLLLSKYTRNEILLPQTRQGIDALIDEVLCAEHDFMHKKFLVLNKTGASSAYRLKERLPDLRVDFLNIYQGQELKQVAVDFQQLFEHDRVQLICATSSAIVAWLFESCRIREQITYLDDIVFLAWHVQITHKLKEYGISVSKIQLID